MSTEAHLDKLEKKHQAIEDEISAELARTAHDDAKVAALKKKKLMIKDEIVRLKQQIQGA